MYQSLILFLKFITKIKNLFFSWISYAFKEREKQKHEFGDDLDFDIEKKKTLKEFLDAAIINNYGEKKKWNVLNKFQKNKYKNNHGIIDYENITNEQKKSMNIWICTLNYNLKKGNSNKLSFHQLENYDYRDVN